VEQPGFLDDARRVFPTTGTLPRPRCGYRKFFFVIRSMTPSRETKALTPQRLNSLRSQSNDSRMHAMKARVRRC